MDDFKRWLDTYESTQDDTKRVGRTYIENNWDPLMDWRKVVKNPPKDARRLGAMEFNQRHIPYWMKKRGMHWSAEGSEAMVKVKQGILSGTLREVYLKDQHRSVRKQREVKKAVRMSELLRQPTCPSGGIKQCVVQRGMQRIAT